MNDNIKPLKYDDTLYHIQDIRFYGLSYEVVLPYLPNILKIKENFNITDSELIDAIKDLQIPFYEIVSYSKQFNTIEFKKGILYKKDAFYEEKYNKKLLIWQTIVYDLYLVENSFISQVVSKLNEYFFAKKYPQFYKAFSIEKNRYPFKLHSLINLNTKIDDISCYLPFEYRNLTIGEIYSMLTSNDEYLKEKINTTLFRFYDNAFALIITKDFSLYVYYADFLERNYQKIYDEQTFYSVATRKNVKLADSSLKSNDKVKLFFKLLKDGE